MTDQLLKQHKQEILVLVATCISVWVNSPFFSCVCLIVPLCSLHCGLLKAQTTLTVSMIHYLTIIVVYTRV